MYTTGVSILNIISKRKVWKYHNFSTVFGWRKLINKYWKQLINLTLGMQLCLEIFLTFEHYILNYYTIKLDQCCTRLQTFVLMKKTFLFLLGTLGKEKINAHSWFSKQDIKDAVNYILSNCYFCYFRVAKKSWDKSLTYLWFLRLLHSFPTCFYTIKKVDG